MSLESIRELSREAALEAAEAQTEPFLLEDVDVEDIRARVNGRGHSGPLFPFPFIGDHRPDNWELLEKLFVDTSGFGEDDEGALSIRQLAAKLEAGKGYALIEVGQFQGYLGVFQKAA